jgi:hypothetical protein
MLIEKAKALSERIAEYDRLKGSANEALQLETRAKQFSEASDAIARTRSALKRFTDVGVPIRFVPKDYQTLIDRAKALRTAVQIDLKTLDDPPFDLKYDFIDRLRSISVSANEEILSAWQSFVRTSGDPVSDDILEALAAVPQYRPVVATIRTCRAKLATLASTVPSDLKTAIEALHTIVKDHRSAWTEMTAEGIPPSVISFLQACAAQGAPLTGLTNEVRGWLESRNLIHAFRIKIK